MRGAARPFEPLDWKRSSACKVDGLVTLDHHGRASTTSGYIGRGSTDSERTSANAVERRSHWLLRPVMTD